MHGRFLRRQRGSVAADQRMAAFTRRGSVDGGRSGCPRRVRALREHRHTRDLERSVGAVIECRVIRLAGADEDRQPSVGEGEVETGIVEL